TTARSSGPIGRSEGPPPRAVPLFARRLAPARWPYPQEPLPLKSQAFDEACAESGAPLPREPPHVEEDLVLCGRWPPNRRWHDRRRLLRCAREGVLAKRPHYEAKEDLAR